MEDILGSSKSIKMIVMTKLDGSSSYLETKDADNWLDIIKHDVGLVSMTTSGDKMDPEPSGVKGLSITFVDNSVISLDENETDRFFRTAQGCVIRQQIRRGNRYNMPQWKPCN